MSIHCNCDLVCLCMYKCARVCACLCDCVYECAVCVIVCMSVTISVCVCVRLSLCVCVCVHVLLKACEYALVTAFLHWMVDSLWEYALVFSQMTKAGKRIVSRSGGSLMSIAGHASSARHCARHRPQSVGRWPFFAFNKQGTVRLLANCTVN
jgi:hypothetical protein